MGFTKRLVETVWEAIQHEDEIKDLSLDRQGEIAGSIAENIITTFGKGGESNESHATHT